MAFNLIQCKYQKNKIKNNKIYLKRNSLIINDLNFMLKTAQNSFKFFYKSEPALLLKKNILAKRQIDKLINKKTIIFFIYIKNDTTVATNFKIAAKFLDGFSLCWDTNFFLFLFKQIKQIDKNFYPIFFIDQQLLNEHSFLKIKSLLSKYPLISFCSFNKQNENNTFIKNNIIPLFLPEKNRNFFFIFWLKFISKFF